MAKTPFKTTINEENEKLAIINARNVLISLAAAYDMMAESTDQDGMNELSGLVNRLIHDNPHYISAAADLWGSRIVNSVY